MQAGRSQFWGTKRWVGDRHASCNLSGATMPTDTLWDFAAGGFPGAAAAVSTLSQCGSASSSAPAKRNGKWLLDSISPFDIGRRSLVSATGDSMPSPLPRRGGSNSSARTRSPACELADSAETPTAFFRVRDFSSAHRIFRAAMIMGAGRTLRVATRGVTTSLAADARSLLLVCLQVRFFFFFFHGSLIKEAYARRVP